MISLKVKLYNIIREIKGYKWKSIQTYNDSGIWYNHTEILKICKDIDLKNINQFVIIGMYRTPHPIILKAHFV